MNIWWSNLKKILLIYSMCIVMGLCASGSWDKKSAKITKSGSIALIITKIFIKLRAREV